MWRDERTVPEARPRGIAALDRPAHLADGPVGGMVTLVQVPGSRQPAVGINAVTAFVSVRPQLSAQPLHIVIDSLTEVVRDDLVNAGVEYVDVPAVRDGNIITGRVPDDLPEFCQEIIKALSE